LGVAAAALAIRQVVPVGVNVIGLQLGYFATALNGPGKSNFPGGLSWTAIFYAFWEPFIAWGVIAAWLLLFRRYMNPAVRHLDMVESPILCCLHHPSGRAGGHQPAASRCSYLVNNSSTTRPVYSQNTNSPQIK